MGESSVTITRSCPDCGTDTEWSGVVATSGGGTTYVRCVCACGVWPLVDLRKTMTPRPKTREPQPIYPAAIQDYWNRIIGRRTA